VKSNKNDFVASAKHFNLREGNNNLNESLKFIVYVFLYFDSLYECFVCMEMAKYSETFLM
jgi:hypothetical protein